MEKNRGYLAQRVTVRLISENRICLHAEMMLSRHQQPHTAIIWDHIPVTMCSLKEIHCIQGWLPGFIPWSYLPVLFPVILEKQPPSSSQRWASLAQILDLHCTYMGGSPLKETEAQQGEGKACSGKGNKKPYLG